MKFDEMQVIWSAQRDEPLFAVDLQAMNSMVRRKSESAQRYAEHFELTIIVVTLLTATLLPIDAWREGGGWHQYVVALMCFGVGMITLFSRKRRHVTEVAFDQSIKGTAERGLDRIDRHIRSLKLLFWLFHLPLGVCAAIGLTIFSNASTPWTWACVAAVTGVSYLGTAYDVRKKLIPQRQDIQDLLTKLAEAEEPNALS